MSDDLAGYIRKYQRAYSDDDIRRSLLHDGYPEAEVEAAFAAVKAERKRARGRQPWILAAFFLAAFSVAIVGWLLVRPSPSLAPPGTDYFPLNVGDRWVYLGYNITPSRPQEFGLERVSLWFEVVGHRLLHGVDLYLVQESDGGVVQQGQTWLPGPPTQWRGDLIYLKTTQGVDWREAHYATNPDELLASRRAALIKFSAMSAPEIGDLATKNLILKTPVRAGETWQAGDYTCKTVGEVSMKGAFRPQPDQAVRVDVTLNGKPAVTRFFVAGEGMAFMTQANAPGSAYPLHVQELLHYYPAGVRPDVQGTPDLESANPDASAEAP